VRATGLLCFTGASGTLGSHALSAALIALDARTTGTPAALRDDGRGFAPISAVKEREKRLLAWRRAVRRVRTR